MTEHTAADNGVAGRIGTDERRLHPPTMVLGFIWFTLLLFWYIFSVDTRAGKDQFFSWAPVASVAFPALLVLVGLKREFLVSALPGMLALGFTALVASVGVFRSGSAEAWLLALPSWLSFVLGCVLLGAIGDNDNHKPWMGAVLLVELALLIWNASTVSRMVDVALTS